MNEFVVNVGNNNNKNSYFTRRTSPRKGISRVHDVNVLTQSKINEITKELHKDVNNKLVCYLFYFIFLLIITIISLVIYFTLIQDKGFIKLIYNNTNVSMTNNEFYIFFNNYISKLNYERGVNMIANDYNYILPDKKFIIDFLKKNKVNKMDYIKDKHDCDNFSFILYGNFLEQQYKNNLKYSFLFGLVYVHNKKTNINHILNFFIDDKYNVYCLEPQDDKINLCKDLPNYTLYRIII